MIHKSSQSIHSTAKQQAAYLSLPELPASAYLQHTHLPVPMTSIDKKLSAYGASRRRSRRDARLGFYLNFCAIATQQLAVEFYALTTRSKVERSRDWLQSFNINNMLIIMMHRVSASLLQERQDDDKNKKKQKSSFPFLGFIKEPTTMQSQYRPPLIVH